MWRKAVDSPFTQITPCLKSQLRNGEERSKCGPAYMLDADDYTGGVTSRDGEVVVWTYVLDAYDYTCGVT